MLADAQRRLGEFQEAKRSYARFLARTSSSDPGRERARQMVILLTTAMDQRELRAKMDLTPEQKILDVSVGSSQGRDWDRLGVYSSIGLTILGSSYLMYQMGQVARLEDEKVHAWSNMRLLDADSYSTISSGYPNGVIQNSCGKAKAISGRMSSESLRGFVSVCNRGERAARLATIGQIGALAGLVSSVYFGYRTWGKTESRATTVMPSLGPTSDGGIQGSVTLSF